MYELVSQNPRMMTISVINDIGVVNVNLNYGDSALTKELTSQIETLRDLKLLTVSRVTQIPKLEEKKTIINTTIKESSEFKVSIQNKKNSEIPQSSQRRKSYKDKT